MLKQTKKLKAYITYEMTPITRAQLLEESISNGTKVIVEGRVLDTRRVIPKEILADLITKRKAQILPTQHISVNGKRKIFGVVDSHSRTIYIDKKKFIRIRILANDLMELMEKISTIKTAMSEFGVQEKICVWDKLGKLNTKIGKVSIEIIPTVRSDFNQNVMIAQKDLELKTLREGYI